MPDTKVHMDVHVRLGKASSVEHPFVGVSNLTFCKDCGGYFAAAHFCVGKSANLPKTAYTQRNA